MLTALEPADGEAILPIDRLKARVRVLDASEDADIRRMLLQAIDFVERYTDKALGRRQFQWVDKQFCTRLRFPIGPVVAVDAISYYDRAGADTALEAESWFVGGDTLHAASGRSWPHASGQAGAVRITFTAGYEDAENEAPMLIAAVELGVGALFANRESPDWSGAMNAADSYRGPGL